MGQISLVKILNLKKPNSKREKRKQKQLDGKNIIPHSTVKNYRIFFFKREQFTKLVMINTFSLQCV